MCPIKRTSTQRPRASASGDGAFLRQGKDGKAIYSLCTHTEKELRNSFHLHFPTVHSDKKIKARSMESARMRLGEDIDCRVYWYLVAAGPDFSCMYLLDTINGWYHPPDMAGSPSGLQHSKLRLAKEWGTTEVQPSDVGITHIHIYTQPLSYSPSVANSIERITQRDGLGRLRKQIVHDGKKGPTFRRVSSCQTHGCGIHPPFSPSRISTLDGR